jgi:hypothetical protein
MYLLHVPFSLGPWLFAGHTILTRSPPPHPAWSQSPKNSYFSLFPARGSKINILEGSKLSLPRSFLSRRIGQKDKKIFSAFTTHRWRLGQGLGVGEGGGSWLPFVITKQGDTHTHNPASFSAAVRKRQDSRKVYERHRKKENT